MRLPIQNQTGFEHSLFSRGRNGFFCLLMLLAAERSVSQIPGGPFILDDFQVNENTGLGYSNQTAPGVAVFGNGEFCASWVDNRSSREDVFIQFFSADGGSLGPTMRANDVFSENGCSQPSIACDRSGRAAVVWRQDDAVYGRLFTLNPQAPIGGVFPVSGKLPGVINYRPAVAMNENGEMFVSWMSSDASKYSIVVRYFSTDGVPSGDPIIVAPVEHPIAVIPGPSTAYDDSGHAAVAWFTGADLAIRLYSGQEDRIGERFLICSDTLGLIGSCPMIRMNSRGEGIAVWQDMRNLNSDIVGRRFSAGSGMTGDDFLVNDDLEFGDSQRYPAVAIGGDGRFSVVWTGKSRIVAQSFDGQGRRSGANTVLIDSLRYPPFVTSSIGMDDEGRVILTWTDGMEAYPVSRIKGRVFRPDGPPVTDVLDIGPDPGACDQGGPVIRTGGSGGFTIAWGDDRTMAWQPYFRVFGDNGIALNGDIAANDDFSGRIENGPLLSLNEDGECILTWSERRAPHGYSAVVARCFSGDGSPAGPVFQVSDPVSEVSQTVFHVGAVEDGTFLVVWRDAWPLDSTLRMQHVGADGQLIGDCIAFGFLDSISDEPCAASDASGNLAVAWVERPEQILRIRFFDASGDSLGDSIAVNGTGMEPSSPRISMSDDGACVVAWTGSLGGDLYLMARAFDSNHLPIGGNIIVSDFTLYREQLVDAAVSMANSGRFIIAWTRGLEDVGFYTYYIFAKNFTASGVPEGAAYLLSNPARHRQSSPNISIRDGKLYSAWVDFRGEGTKSDIWANVRLIPDSDGVEADPSSARPEQPWILANYPNPFNASTTIYVSTANSCSAYLAVYDLSGRRVGTLLDGTLEQGERRITWSAEGCASGIYRIVLDTVSGKVVRKAVLQR